MTKRAGRSVALKIDVSGTYVAIGVMKSIAVRVNSEPVDVTNMDSAGWRELLEAAGTKSVTISGDGIFDNADANHQAMQTNLLAQTHDSYKVEFGTVPDETWTGSFFVAQYERTGEYNGAITFSLTLESTGAIAVS